MPRILTVDDSRAVRIMVKKHLAPLALDIDEAEDGQDGLNKLEGQTYDLVLLDVTMPVLDGPGMLKKMRDSGDVTPVIMLTAESGTSIIGQAMKLGIEDYILKPFTPEEINGKVCKVLNISSAQGAAPATTIEKVDILCIDDVANVHERFRAALPEQFTCDPALSVDEAMKLCRTKKYKVILLDNTLDGVDIPSAIKQMRILQQGSKILMIGARTPTVGADAAKLGFNGVLTKPFSTEQISGFAIDQLGGGLSQLMVPTEDVIKVAASPDPKMNDRYFVRLRLLIKDAFAKVAGSCYSTAFIDMTDVPSDGDSGLLKFVIALNKHATEMGLTITLVGSQQLADCVTGMLETKGVRVATSLDEARAQQKAA